MSFSPGVTRKATPWGRFQSVMGEAAIECCELKTSGQSAQLELRQHSPPRTTAPWTPFDGKPSPAAGSRFTIVRTRKTFMWWLPDETQAATRMVNQSAPEA